MREGSFFNIIYWGLGCGVVMGVSVLATYCVVSATLTAAICCFAKTVGRTIGLIDKPDGVRKLHGTETPLVGGLALLIPSFAVSIVYLVSTPSATFLLVAVAASAITLVLGVADDRFGISPVWRLLVLMFMVFSVFSLEPLFVLHTLYFALFGSSIAVHLDPFAASITVLAILGFANAANMADGINGQLLGSIIIWSVFVGLHLGAPFGFPFVAIVCSALVTIVFNLRGKLFSGSSGAYAAAMFCALGAIAAYRLQNRPVAAEEPMLWFWLPILDCARLMVMRTIRSRSPLSGDRCHFHHFLSDHMGTRYALFVYLVLLAAPGAAAMINTGFGSAILLLCGSVYFSFLIWNRAQRVASREDPTFVEFVPKPLALSPRAVSRSAPLERNTEVTARVDAKLVSPVGGA